MLPEPGDRMVHLGNLDPQEGLASLDVDLGRAAFEQFDPDLVTVTRAGSDPANDRLLSQHCHTSSTDSIAAVSEARSGD